MPESDVRRMDIGELPKGQTTATSDWFIGEMAVPLPWRLAAWAVRGKNASILCHAVCTLTLTVRHTRSQPPACCHSLLRRAVRHRLPLDESFLPRRGVL